jgi:hypothetical protein
MSETAEQELANGLSAAISGSKKVNAELAKGIRAVVKSVSDRRTAFAERKAAVEHDIRRGSRLSDHRFNI